jgi:hypothetical protein
MPTPKDRGMGGIVMSLATNQIQTIAAPRNAFERLELARELFQMFHAQCFWHSPRGLDITEEHLDFVAKGLCENGGRLGFMLSGKLRPNAFD